MQSLHDLCEKEKNKENYNKIKIKVLIIKKVTKYFIYNICVIFRNLLHIKRILEKIIKINYKINTIKLKTTNMSVR